MTEVRALRPGEEEECIALWRTAWPGDNDAYFRRYLFGDVEWLPYYTQVAVESGRIVSAAHICKRTVHCGDFRLQIGGLANVATLPEYRGRGLNTACLRAAITVMEADALDFSLLFTGINGYYARLGYATVPRRRLRVTLQGRIEPPAGRFAVRDAVEDDVPGIQAIYDAYNRGRPIAVLRSPAYWRDWVGLTPARLRAGEPPLVAVDAAGRLAGYACYQVNFYQGHQITEDYAYISEFGSATSQRAAPVAEDEPVSANAFSADEIAAALLKEIACRAMRSGKRELHLSVALDDSVCRAVEGLSENRSVNGSVTGSVNVTESGMARLLHRDGLLRSLLLEWNDRWIEAGRPAGAVVFATPYGPVRLDATQRFLRIEKLDGELPALPQEALLGLLFGFLTVEQAAGEGVSRPLLEALFPPRDSVYWSADGF